MRALIYRIGSIGDAVVGIPAMRAFHSAFSPSHTTLLSDAGLDPAIGIAALLEGSGLVDQALSYEAPHQLHSVLALLRRVRQTRSDIALYIPPRLRSTWEINRDRMFLRACGIRRIIGPRRSRLSVDQLRAAGAARLTHDATDLIEMLREEGIAAPDVEARHFDLHLSASEQADADALLSPIAGTNLLAFAPGTKWPSKKWPLAYSHALIKRLVDELDLMPVVIGGASDRADADALIHSAGRGMNLCGRIPVRVAACVIRRCRIFVGNDSGPMHLAYSVGVPCVVPFSAQDAAGRWEPFDRVSRVLRSDVPCAGCLLQVCPRENECLRLVTPSIVFAAVDALVRNEQTAASALP